MKHEMNHENIKPMNAFNLLSDLAGQLSGKDKEDYDYYSILGDISIAIVNFRAEHELTQGRLAELLGVSQAMVSKYESGDYNFTLQTLNHVCHILGLKMNMTIRKKGNWQVGCEAKEREDDTDFIKVDETPNPEYAPAGICGGRGFAINDETEIV